MRRWVIYVLKCPITKEVRYVGKTERAIEKRLDGHIYESIKKPKITRKTGWIFALVSEGLTPIIESVQSGEGGGWEAAERKWIAFYRSAGVDLVNGNGGGAGSATGLKTSEEWREIAKRRYSAKTDDERSAFRGKSWTQKTPEERSAIMKAARVKRGPITEEQKRAMHDALRAKYTPEQRSERARKRQFAKTSEKRLEESRKSNVTHTHEARVIAAKKAWLTRKANYAKDPDAAHQKHVDSGNRAAGTRQRREAQDPGSAKKSRADALQKNWATRRAKQAARSGDLFREDHSAGNSSALTASTTISAGASITGADSITTDPARDAARA